MPTLDPYQVTGAQFLSTRSAALLADEPGLGKTCQAIAAADHVGAKQILVVCPAMVRRQWAREIERWSTERRTIQVIESAKDVAAALGAGVAITSYELATAHAAKLAGVAWGAVILDEAHFLKNPTAKRTRALLGRQCDRRGGISERAGRLWFLTGTPAPNDVSELYPMLRACGAWPSGQWPFIESFCKFFQTQYGIKITGTKNAPRLKQLMEPVMLRRTEEEVGQERPACRYADLVIDGKELHELSTSLSAIATLEQTPKIQALIDLAKADKMEEAHAHFKHFTEYRKNVGLAKVHGMVDYIKAELANGVQKIVIFAIHRDVIRFMQALLVDEKPVTVWGGMTPEKREKAVERFISHHYHRVMLANITAAGTGLDGLQKVSSRVIVMEPSWSPNDNHQAVRRLDRRGQAKPVLAQFVSLAGSIDEQINRTLIRKAEELAKVLDI